MTLKWMFAGLFCGIGFTLWHMQSLMQRTKSLQIKWILRTRLTSLAAKGDDKIMRWDTGRKLIGVNSKKFRLPGFPSGFPRPFMVFSPAALLSALRIRGLESQTLGAFEQLLRFSPDLYESMQFIWRHLIKTYTSHIRHFSLSTKCKECPDVFCVFKRLLCQSVFMVSHDRELLRWCA